MSDKINRFSCAHFGEAPRGPEFVSSEDYCGREWLERCAKCGDVTKCALMRQAVALERLAEFTPQVLKKLEEGRQAW